MIIQQRRARAAVFDRSMSVGKNKSPSSPSRKAEEELLEGRDSGGGEGEGAVVQRKESGAGKKAADQRRYARCFSGLDLSIGPGPLRDVDAGKLKGQIRKWAKAVVAYARQLSFGSPRSSGGSAGATPRSKSGLGGARPEQQPPP